MEVTTGPPQPSFFIDTSFRVVTDDHHLHHQPNQCHPNCIQDLKIASTYFFYPFLDRTKLQNIFFFQVQKSHPKTDTDFTKNDTTHKDVSSSRLDEPQNSFDYAFVTYLVPVSIQVLLTKFAPSIGKVLTLVKLLCCPTVDSTTY